MRLRSCGLLLLLGLVACGGGGGSGSCPNVQSGVDAGWPTIDEVANCEGCSSGSEVFTCSGSTDVLTITCANNQIEGTFASTSDCTEGGVSCFNGAINVSCVDTASE